MGYVFKPIPQILDVISVVSNSPMFERRNELFQEFKDYWASQPYTRHWIVELAIGDRPYELTEESNPRHIQLRSKNEIWHKENMVNIAVNYITQVQPDFEKIAWIDADVIFTRRDIVQATLQQLEIHPIVQMFSHGQDLSPKNIPIPDEHGNGVFDSFAFKHQNRIIDEQITGIESYSALGHPGYAWACTRKAFRLLGGLLDICIVGSADWEMAMGLVGRIHQAHPPGISVNYSNAIWQWGDNAYAQFKGDLGYVDGLVNHYWHGSKKKRSYISRWKIMTESKFDQLTDVRRDEQGLWMFTGNKPLLRDGLRKLFRHRDEDSIEL